MYSAELAANCSMFHFFFDNCHGYTSYLVDDGNKVSFQYRNNVLSQFGIAVVSSVFIFILANTSSLSSNDLDIFLSLKHHNSAYYENFRHRLGFCNIHFLIFDFLHFREKLSVWRPCSTWRQFLHTEHK